MSEEVDIVFPVKTVLGDSDEAKYNVLTKNQGKLSFLYDFKNSPSTLGYYLGWGKPEARVGVSYTPPLEQIVTPEGILQVSPLTPQERKEFISSYWASYQRFQEERKKKD